MTTLPQVPNPPLPNLPKPPSGPKHPYTISDWGMPQGPTPPQTYHTPGHPNDRGGSRAYQGGGIFTHLTDKHAEHVTPPAVGGGWSFGRIAHDIGSGLQKVGSALFGGNTPDPSQPHGDGISPDGLWMNSTTMPGKKSLVNPPKQGLEPSNFVRQANEHDNIMKNAREMSAEEPDKYHGGDGLAKAIDIQKKKSLYNQRNQDYNP